MTRMPILKPKKLIGWMVYDVSVPFPEAFTETFAHTRSESIALFTYNGEISWEQEYDAGFRCFRVTITPKRST